MWKIWIEAHPTNNPGERKALRAAFIGGAEAVLDHQLSTVRLGQELDASYVDSGLSLVVDNQTLPHFKPAPEDVETDCPGNIEPKP